MLHTQPVTLKRQHINLYGSNNKLNRSVPCITTDNSAPVLHDVQEEVAIALIRCGICCADVYY